MTNKLITIVTVVYNAEQLIEETMQSVINQTVFDEVEYVIVDGSSTDKTLEIIHKYKDKIDILVSEPDEGIYEAMNKAIDLANCEWINFMNAGDTFQNKKTLENVTKKIDSSSDVIYGDRYYIKDNKRRLQLAKSIDTIFERMPFGHQSAFIRNVLLKKYKFNETYKFAADYDLFVKLYLNGHKFLYIELPICNFISGGKSESGIRPYLEAIKILLDNCKDKNVIKSNAYFNSFRKNSSKLLDSIIDN